MSTDVNVPSTRRESTPGRMAAWILLAAAIVGLLLLIYSSPR